MPSTMRFTELVRDPRTNTTVLKSRFQVILNVTPVDVAVMLCRSYTGSTTAFMSQGNLARFCQNTLTEQGRTAFAAQSRDWDVDRDPGWVRARARWAFEQLVTLFPEVLVGSDLNTWLSGYTEDESSS